MAKSKIKTTKRLGVLLAAVGIATVLLASYTLARFSTSAGGGGTSSIALWDVTITPQTNTTLPSSSYDSAVSFGKLSPGSSTQTEVDNRAAADGYTTAGTYIVYNSSSSKQLGTVTYQTSVDVGFTIESSDFTLVFSDGSTLDSSGAISCTDTGSHSCVASKVNSATNTIQYYFSTTNTSATYNVTNGTNNVTLGDQTPTYSEITDLYSLRVYYNIGGSSAANDNVYFESGSNSTGHTYSIPSTANSSNGNWAASPDAETEVYIVAKLVWSIKKPSSGSSPYYWASYLCDWVGKYVESVSCSFTYTARQASDTGS